MIVEQMGQNCKHYDGGFGSTRKKSCLCGGETDCGCENDRARAWSLR